MKKILSLVMLVLSIFITNHSSVCFSKELNGNKINEVFIVNHGWHTGFVIPSEKILRKIPALAERFNNNTYIEFGWGDEGFYQSREFSLGIAISAIFWPTESVIHSVAVPIDVESYFLNSEITLMILALIKYYGGGGGCEFRYDQ